MLPIPRRTITTYSSELKNILCLVLRKEVLRGTKIKEFEQAFAHYIGTKHAIAVSSGRIALEQILSALSLKNADEIIISSYNDQSVPFTIEALGLKPVFVDIDNATHNIDIALIEEKITDKTRVIMATHLLGRPCDLDKLFDIAKKHNLFLVEDCAHSLGAYYGSKRTGSVGKAALFSFAPTKPFNLFGGGAITTNDDVIATKIKKAVASYRAPTLYSIFKRVTSTFVLRFLTMRPIFSVTLFPIVWLMYMMNKEPIRAYYSTMNKGISTKTYKTSFTNLQAVVGLKLLKEIDGLNLRRQSNAKLLANLLKDDVSFPKGYGYSESIFYFFNIMSKDIYKLSKKALYSGIDTGKYVMHNCASLFGVEDLYKVTEQVFEQSLQIPVYPQLTRRDIECIAKIFNKEYFQGDNNGQ